MWDDSLVKSGIASSPGEPGLSSVCRASACAGAWSTGTSLGQMRSSTMPSVPRLTRHSWKSFSSTYSHIRNKEMECLQKKPKKSAGFCI